MKKPASFYFFLLLIVHSIVTTQCGKTDNPPTPTPPAVKPGAVKGRVTNEYNQLLNNTIITLQPGGNSTPVTTSKNDYIFSGLQPGSYNITVKKDGYIETTAPVTITAGDTINKDFVLKSGTAYCNLVSDSVVIAKPFSSSFFIKISSNTSWVIVNGNAWLVPDKTGSSGDDSMMVRVAGTSADTIRQGFITIQAGSITRNILVKQLPEVKLLQTIAMPGNSMLAIKDSIALLFNQPVTVKSIFPGLTYCQSEIRYSYTGNKVTFSYACAALGGDYPFTITTVNSVGDQYNFAFNVGFYQKAINLTGTIQSYFVNDADNSYWIITDHPNALYKIDMTTLDILHTYNLTDEPSLFTISPYNNKIYLAYRRVPKLYIMNQDGNMEQVIDIPHDTARSMYEYDGPMIYPAMLSFTSNGKGMIWLNNIYGNSYPLYWFIDAADNHRIWYQSLAGGNSTNYYSAGKVNFDKTKLVLTGVNNDPTITLFDPLGMSFTSRKPAGTVENVLAPSRKNADIFIGQSILNAITGAETPVINTGGQITISADFTYKPGKDAAVYYTDNGYMRVLDYNTHSTPVKYDAINFLRGTTSTPDGRSIIANRHDGNYNAKVIQLPAAWFDY